MTTSNYQQHPSTSNNAIKLWSPPEHLLRSSHMTMFAKLVAARHPNTAGTKVTFTHSQRPLVSYTHLYKFSTTHIALFWREVADYVGLRWSIDPADPVVDEHARVDSFPFWFPSARLNFAETLLFGTLQANLDFVHTALISATEALDVIHISRAQLIDQVRCVASAMVAVGVMVGDRVAAYTTNCIDTVVIMLAAASLGAIWSSTSPDFGVQGVLDRFQQIQPKLLFSINAITYNGRIHNHLPKLAQVLQGLDQCVERVIVIPHLASESMELTDLGPKAISLASFLALGDASRPLEFTPLPFKHPLYILFSSGTTGKPKCIVHSAGGTLLQHLKEHVIHGNLGKRDVFLQYTTTGWMMWHWLVSALATGATLVLYDGSPFKPTADVLWQLIHQLRVTVFGTSAKYIQSMQEFNVDLSRFNISQLRTIYSTGSPLKPESFDYVYTHIKSDVLLGSITGGTDIISLFAGHNTNLPVYRGELQCRCLGMDIAAWQGKPVFGISGDLVCLKPFPCMPVYFWGDHGMTLYKKAYFIDFPELGIWSHGDFITINPVTLGLVMLGRSDGTLNPSGVRFGSAELYNIIEKFPQVTDSLVVGQKIGSDERVIMFLQLPDGKELGTDLTNAIKAKIRSELSSRHVPAVIVQVPDIPYTNNGKKVEVPVKKILSGESVPSTGALRNPESLQYYCNIPQLKL